MIDLNVCVGCHACAVACKEWNTAAIPGRCRMRCRTARDPAGMCFNRVHSYAVEQDTPRGNAMTVHFPKSCLHCEDPPCVTVCPTGASYKRAEDGIVLVDYDKCIGCKFCAWACPYGARELRRGTRMMKKCTLCVDRIYDETLDPSRPATGVRDGVPDPRAAFRRSRRSGVGGLELVAERGGYALMPEFGYQPVNRYLPPRPRRDGCDAPKAQAPREETLDRDQLPGVLRWLDRALSR